MILIFGGTTEGRVAVQVLEEAGKPFYYSTRRDEQEVALHNGIRLAGAMGKEEMTSFCQEHDVRLLIDAAHPFAELLHETVRQASEALSIPVVRFERIYPALADESIVWCDDYADAIRRLKAADVFVLLALTGVQTIEKLKPLWQEGTCCYFRILDRESSRAIARQQGFPFERLCYYYEGEDNDRELMSRLTPDAILMKESGVSGGFCRKVEAARALSIRIFVIRRPRLPESFICVEGPHGLRRAVEKLLPDFFDLHSGLTTGTCATAAAIAAVYGLFGSPMLEVPVCLPNGETIRVSVCQDAVHDGSATVIKDAGDDPDVTNGTLICATVQQTDAEGQADYAVHVCGGKGVGTVTLPGLGLPINAAAINETPRRMIEENVTEALRRNNAPAGTYTVTISVPEGVRLAERTFNPRLGVVGGISIIGTSGIVKPFSSDAFVQSIRKSMEVARAAGSRCVVINSGAKSERFLRGRYPDLPPQAFVHYGNFIGETIKIAAELRVPRLVMGLMIGKAVKLAEGNLDTHSKHTVMNKDFIREVAAEAGCSAPTLAAIPRLGLARELWDVLQPDELLPFSRCLVRRCLSCCSPLLPEGELTIHLITDEGRILPVP